MGNAALRDLAVVEPIALGELAGAVVAIDAHNWLYKYLTTTVRFTASDAYTTRDGDEVANLIGTLRGIAKLLEADIVPVLVFDGVPTELKDDELADRREARERAEERLAEAREAGDVIEAARLDSQTQRLTPTIHETTRELLAHLGVPVVEAPAEGEAQCAHMARHDRAVDYAGSDDYDTLLFGAPLTLRGLTSSGDPDCMRLDATLERHGITWEQLVDVGILAGTDFNDGLAGVGPKTALREIREHGDLWGVLDARGAAIDHAERVRALFLDPPVTDDYTIEATVQPDLSAARAYVIEQWEIPPGEVDRAFGRIEAAAVQTGLDRWS